MLCWRVYVMASQVEGNEGFKYLMRRVKQGEVSVLYQVCIHRHDV
jgi:hypothetical protein